MDRIPFGLILTGFTIIFCGTANFSNAHLVLALHVPVIGVPMTFLFLCFSVLSVASFCLAVMHDAGPLPEYLSCSQVEMETKAELLKYASRVEENLHVPAIEVKAEGQDASGPQVDEDEVNANKLVADRVQQRIMSTQDMSDEYSGTVEENLERENDRVVFDRDNASHPEEMERRRKRKARYGLRVRTVGEVARDILKAMDAGGEEKRRELRNFFDKIEMCSLCQIYQLQSTYHCRHCQHCVVIGSNHCCSLGQCIGQGNHKFYCLFMFYLVLSAGISFFATVLVLVHGWNYFISVEGQHLMFYASFDLTTAFLMTGTAYLCKHLHSIGCGESLIKEMKRGRANSAHEAHRETSVGVFTALPQEEVTPKPVFRWTNIKRVLGDERQFYRYFLPVEPNISYDLKSEAKNELKELIVFRLHCLADISSNEPLPA